jgi:ABC-type sulfate/molybdate transport systems ATPase subunit
MHYLKLLKADHFKLSMPNSLSGGEQQRVAIARAMAPEPKLLLMDEPFSSLDSDLREKLRSETRQLFKETKTSCIIVSHDRDDAIEFCDSVKLLKDKQLKEIQI